MQATLARWFLPVLATLPLVATVPGEPADPRKRPRLEDRPDAAPLPGASPAGPTAPQPSLPGLPHALKQLVAGFAGPSAVRELNRDYQAAARFATRELTLRFNLPLEDLLERVAAHPQVRVLRFGHGPQPDLSLLLTVLAHFPHLEELDTRSLHLPPETLGQLAQSHPRLCRLKLGTGLTAHDLGRFAERLTHLTLEGRVPGLDEALHGCGRLASLRVLWCEDFQGDHLPASLRQLDVEDCRNFLGTHLPAGLTHLRLTDCPTFLGTLQAPALTTLAIEGSSRLTPDQIAALGHAHPKLTALTLGETLAVNLDALRPCADRLTHLALSCGRGLGSASFQAFTRLASLRLHDAPGFTGADLPASLRRLDLTACPAFQSDHLATTALAELFAGEGCTGITGAGLPATLSRLWLEGPSGVTPKRLTAAVSGLPNLRSLVFRDWRRGRLAPETFAAHPSLREVITQRHLREVQARWVRPEAPAPAGPEA